MEFREILQQEAIVIKGDIIKQAIPLLREVFEEFDYSDEVGQLFEELVDFWQTTHNSIRVEDPKSKLVSLRYFIDSLYELSFLRTLDPKVEFVVIEDLVAQRRASINLGFFEEDNRKYGAYYDDKNLLPFTMKDDDYLAKEFMAT